MANLMIDGSSKPSENCDEYTQDVNHVARDGSVTHPMRSNAKSIWYSSQDRALLGRVHPSIHSIPLNESADLIE